MLNGYQHLEYRQSYSGGSSNVLSSSVIPFDTWVHVAIVVDATDVRIYINGKLDTKATIADNAASDSNFSISDAGQSLMGNLDEFRIYSRALTDDEIAYLYQNPSGPIPAMFGAHRIVADSITAREVAADTGLFAKIKTSNLDVDAYGSVTNLNAGLVYDGNPSHVVASSGNYALLLTSPSPVAGKYALNYFDLSNGKLRVGSNSDTSKYLYVDGPNGVAVWTGDLKANTIQTTSYIKNSGDTIRICGDTTANSFDDGIIMGTRAISSSVVAGDVRLVTNLYSSSPYIGVVREARKAAGSPASYSGVANYFKEHVLFSSSASRLVTDLYQTSAIYVKQFAQTIDSDGAQYFVKAQKSSVRWAEMDLISDIDNPYAQFAVRGAGDAYGYFTFEPLGVTSTSYADWFTPSAGEAGFIFFSDIATGGISYGFGWYARNATVAVYNNLGGNTQAQASGTKVQVKAASASYKMTFTKIRML